MGGGFTQEQFMAEHRKKEQLGKKESRGGAGGSTFAVCCYTKQACSSTAPPVHLICRWTEGHTLVVPVDAGDLDLLCGDVLLQELPPLQPLPQCALARVPVPTDDDLHCGWGHTEKSVAHHADPLLGRCADGVLVQKPREVCLLYF